MTTEETRTPEQIARDRAEMEQYVTVAKERESSAAAPTGIPSRWEINLDLRKAKCPDCQEFIIDLKEMVILGRPRLVPVADYCESCQAKREETERREKERRAKEALEWRRANIEELLTLAGVPRRYLQCSLENFKGKLPKARPSFITGPVGTGKTHAAVAFLREEIILNGRSAGYFLRCVDLFKEIRDTYHENSSESERAILDRYGKVPLLILDDLGTEKISEWVEQTLYDLIDKRYGEMLDTVITSNLTLEQLREHYKSHGDRLSSRIAGMGRELIFKGKDLRVR